MENRLYQFIAVADSGNFTQAAASLHISQPALSTAIHKLERELQTPLYVRGSRPLKLTPAGTLAYTTAKEIAISTSNLRTRLAELAQADIPLRIGMIDSVASNVFGKHYNLGILDTSSILSVMVDNSRMLVTAVEQDEVDIAFITGGSNVSNASLQVHPLATEPLVTVCAQAHHASSEAAVKSGILPNFISYDQHSTTYQLIQQALRSRGITTKPSVYSTSPEVTLNLVRTQHGTSVLPYTMVAPLLQTKELSLISAKTIGVITRPISIVQRRDKTLPKPTSRLVRQARRALLAATEAAEGATNSNRT